MTFVAPCINLIRDPRWGRAQESYSEDVWLTTQMGLAYIRGMQGHDPRYLKTAALVKHFAVHSQEAGRFDHSFDVSERAMRGPASAMIWSTHSLASARLMPLFIEAGVDILDPIQVSAKGMEMSFLAREFGDRIVFHGGIDTQHLLPEGSPEEVCRAVRSTLELFEGRGHYIMAPSQILNTDIPLENVLAMYRAATLNRDTSI